MISLGPFQALQFSGSVILAWWTDTNRHRGLSEAWLLRYHPTTRFQLLITSLNISYQNKTHDHESTSGWNLLMPGKSLRLSLAASVPLSLFESMAEDYIYVKVDCANPYIISQAEVFGSYLFHQISKTSEILRANLLQPLFFTEGSPNSHILELLHCTWVEAVKSLLFSSPGQTQVFLQHTFQLPHDKGIWGNKSPFLPFMLFPWLLFFAPNTHAVWMCVGGWFLGQKESLVIKGN